MVVYMGLHPQIRLNIRLSPEALMNKAFTDLTSQAQEVGTHVESLDTRAPHQVAQMGRSGPRPSSQQTVTATPPLMIGGTMFWWPMNGFNALLMTTSLTLSPNVFLKTLTLAILWFSLASLPIQVLHSSWTPLVIS